MDRESENVRWNLSGNGDRVPYRVRAEPRGSPESIVLPVLLFLVHASPFRRSWPKVNNLE